MSKNPISRRTTLKTGLAVGLASSLRGHAGQATPVGAPAAASVDPTSPEWADPARIEHIRSAKPLVNAERARAIMDRYQLDGLVAAIPRNIYYLSSHHGIMQWMGRHFSTYAFFPRREDAEAALIVPSAMLYHLDYRPTWVPSIKVYTRPQLAEDGAVLLGEDGSPIAVAEPRFWPVREGARYARGDLVQLALFAEFRGHTSVDALHGLKEAIVSAGAARGRLGFDDPRVGNWLQQIGLKDHSSVDAANIFKEIRMVKTEAEISLLREAARRNEEALDYAISQIRPGLPLDEIEQAHARRWGELGGRGKWLIANVNGLNSGTVEAGDFMKLDSVGVYRGYHGDVGRTVSVGPPTEELSRRIEANTKVSRQVYQEIRPGMKFVDAARMFSALMRDEGFEIAFGAPHCVGLDHTDQPIDVGVSTLPGSLGFGDLTFEAGTVFTLDMPHNEMGWGTSHVEDMIVVRETGFEALSSMDTRLKVRPLGERGA